jgi:hypothetical protein
MVGMSTDVDASPGRLRYYRWLAVLVVLATVAVVVMLRAGGSAPAQPAGSGGTAGSAGQAMSPALRAEVAARLVKALEDATPAEHHNHGHEVTTGGLVVCAVDPFGVNPPGAATVDQVATVYALHLCAVAEPGRSWDMSVRYSGPLAANLGDPPVVTVVQPGAGYPDRLHNLIPQQYWTRATGPFLDEAALADLRRRFDAARR